MNLGAGILNPGTPELDAYQGALLRGRQEEMQGLQQLQGILSIRNAVMKQQQEEKLRGLLAKSGGDPEKAMQGVLAAGDVSAAHALAPLVKIAQENRQREETPRLLAQIYGGGATPASGQPQQLGEGQPVAVAGEDAAPQAPKLARIEQLKQMSLLPAFANNPAALQRIQSEIDALSKDPQVSPLAKLIAERDALPVGHPNRALYDQAITHATNPQSQRIIIPPQPRQPQVIGTTEGYFTLDASGNPQPLRGPAGSPLMPPSAGRIDFQASNQLQRQYNAAVKPSVDSLGAVSVYRNARETGDTAQAMTMAAEALRRSARAGNTRFKGEAEKILGGGYGGGSLVERIENFLSTEFRGTPSNETISRLDRLIDANENAALEQMARQAKFYAGSARGRNINLRQVTGEPFVQGNKVVFPDGTFAQFRSGQDADGAARKWVEANQ